jgi:hypothetical protein
MRKNVITKYAVAKIPVLNTYYWSIVHLRVTQIGGSVIAVIILIMLSLSQLIYQTWIEEQCHEHHHLCCSQCSI